jgi:transposase InsO family protein
VPHPEVRQGLALKAHEQLGHLGEKRTAALLMMRYWWRNLYSDASAVVKACENCSRAKAAFIHRPTELDPLPIKGMFYRWGVDFVGDLPPTPRGNRYALVWVEHWSKVVTIVPVPDKEAATATYAFLHNILARFGAPAEVVTDQGGEWEREFHRLLTEAMGDHRITSAKHPSSNGLAERVVQTLKQALRRAARDAEVSTDWGIHSTWLALGYNCFPQASTRIAPYQVLYGRIPTIPSAVQEAMNEPLAFDGEVDPLDVVADVLQRGAAVKRACPAID